jgi:hypothetical protein
MEMQSSQSGSTELGLASDGRVPPPLILSWHGMWGLALLLPLAGILYAQLRWGVQAVPVRVVINYGAVMLPLALVLRLHHTNEQLLCRRRHDAERIRELAALAPCPNSRLRDVLTVELRGPIEEHRLRRDASEWRARQRADLAVVVVVVPALVQLMLLLRELPGASSPPWSVGAVLISPFLMVAGVLWRAARKEWDEAATSARVLQRMQAVLAGVRISELAGTGPRAVDVKRLLNELCPTSSKATPTKGSRSHDLGRPLSQDGE